MWIRERDIDLQFLRFSVVGNVVKFCPKGARADSERADSLL